MTTCTNSQAPPPVLDPCAVLNQAIQSAQEYNSGGGISEIRLRDRTTKFFDNSSSNRLDYLRSLLRDPLFKNCQAYRIGLAIAGMSPRIGPGVMSRAAAPDPCGCNSPTREGLCS